MKYARTILIRVDTATNKIIITANDDLRIALTPVTRRGSDVYAVVNDKPSPSLTTPAQVLRFLAQAMLTKDIATSIKES